MAQNTQRTIKLFYVEVIEKKTLATVFSDKVYEDSEDGAEKIVLAEYLVGTPEDKKKTEKARVFTRVVDIEKFTATCKMTDYIQLCVDKGTVEKIEG